MRMKHGLAAAIFAVSLPVQAKDPLANIHGTWKIKTILGSGAAASLSEREARQLIGKTFLVETTQFTFNGRPCTETRYEETVEEKDAHFEREWNTTVSDIPLPDPLTVIDTGCNVLYRLKSGKLMVTEKGVFFEAARMKRKGSR
jgi:hypothetical protein